jgi:hypothetical protein
MAETRRDTFIVDSDPQAASHRLERTTPFRSPHTQSVTQRSDIQETNEDICQTDRIYHFQNCGTVNIDSFNARGVRMKNCGNNLPQVTCLFIFLFFFSFHLTWPYAYRII